LKKVISPVRIIFKGSGFYSTDNKSPSGDIGTIPPAKKDKKDDAKGSTPAKEKESKETKPVEKSE
jgi:predicted nucleic acid-binding Zn ribbon protein